MPRARIPARCRTSPRKPRNWFRKRRLRAPLFYWPARADCGCVVRTRYPAWQRWRTQMKIDLSDKTALVTGSTAGIGHAIAKGLAAAGADVVINGRSQAKVDAAVVSIVRAVAHAKVRGIAADVSTAA